MRKTPLLLLLLPCGMNALAILTGCSQPAEVAGTATTALGATPVATSAQGRPPAKVVALSAEPRGLPRFLRATERQPAPTGASAPAAARFHLAAHAHVFGRTPAALERTVLRHVHDVGRGGIIVTLGQRAHGLEVYRGEVKVLMHRNLDLVAISGSLLPAPATAPAFAWSAQDALAAALAEEYAVPLPALTAVVVGDAPGGFARVDLAQPVPVAAGVLRLGKPARVKPVLFATGGRERPAYFVELFAGTGARAFQDAFRFVVAADDLEILERRDLTMKAQFRVWADADGRPQDGPQADFTPHPTGRPDGSSPAFVEPGLVTMNGFNHNPAGLPDPWLAAGATETRGNNVDAYADLGARDGFTAGDVRATTTAPDVFDRVYDPLLAPHASEGQLMAGITQAFYVTNWLHDWYYDSGFDEAAGNAQRNNYGRGGLGADPLYVETQDYSGSDNSDMQAASDGESPRMQAYQWTGSETRSLRVEPLEVTMPTGPADFGQASFDLTAEVALAAGSSTALNDACGRVSPRVSGRIALADRGTCSFKQKAVNVAAAGATGLLLANNVIGGPMPMGDGTPRGAVDLAVLSISMEDGAALREALRVGTVSTHLRRVAGMRRDGALDNTVIAHEWGHLLHLRLADCSGQQCAAMSEGWGDFLSLHMVLREGDDLRGAYALAIYASGATNDAAYFGIRRAPYSIDPRKNPFTFRHISDAAALPTTARIQDTGASNSEVHAAGEIWTQMLFEVYVALLQQTVGPSATRTYQQVRRKMSDYIVAGLKLTPIDATYTEGRDAILAAIAAESEADSLTAAAAFARRGAGSCAVSPARESSDFSGVVESSDVKPALVLGAVTLDDSVVSCDGNGVLDAGEQGVLRVQVSNPSPAPATPSVLTVSSTSTAVAFPAGATLAVPALPAFGAATVTVAVALEPRYVAMTLLPFDLSLVNASACETQVTRSAAFRTNFQERPASSRTDSVEGSETAWQLGGRDAAAVWSRKEAAPGDHEWHGEDLGNPSDTWLESPDLQVSTSGALKLTFLHSHDFEVGEDRGGLTYFDGAVIELTSNDGTSWTDVATLANPGYAGTIDGTSGNVLAGRQALVGRNPSYPDKDRVTLDLGTSLAGMTVRVRFRIGTDQAAGGQGWALDNLSFAGIDNTPFSQLTHKASACSPPELPAREAPAFQQPYLTGCSTAGGDGAAFGGLLAVLALLLFRHKAGRRTRRGTSR